MKKRGGGGGGGGGGDADQGAGFFHRAAFQPSQNIPSAGHVQAF